MEVGGVGKVRWRKPPASGGDVIVNESYETRNLVKGVALVEAIITNERVEAFLKILEALSESGPSFSVRLFSVKQRCTPKVLSVSFLMRKHLGLPPCSRVTVVLSR